MLRGIFHSKIVTIIKQEGCFVRNYRRTFIYSSFHCFCSRYFNVWKKRWDGITCFCTRTQWYQAKLWPKNELKMDAIRPLQTGRTELHLPSWHVIVELPDRLYLGKHKNLTWPPWPKSEPILYPCSGEPGFEQDAETQNTVLITKGPSIHSPLFETISKSSKKIYNSSVLNSYVLLRPIISIT